MGVRGDIVFCAEASTSQEGLNRIWKNEYD